MKRLSSRWQCLGVVAALLTSGCAGETNTRAVASKADASHRYYVSEGGPDVSLMETEAQYSVGWVIPIGISADKNSPVSILSAASALADRTGRDAKVAPSDVSVSVSVDATVVVVKLDSQPTREVLNLWGKQVLEPRAQLLADWTRVPLYPTDQLSMYGFGVGSRAREALSNLDDSAVDFDTIRRQNWTIKLWSTPPALIHIGGPNIGALMKVAAESFSPTEPPAAVIPPKAVPSNIEAGELVGEPVWGGPAVTFFWPIPELGTDADFACFRAQLTDLNAHLTDTFKDEARSGRLTGGVEFSAQGSFVKVRLQALRTKADETEVSLRDKLVAAVATVDSHRNHSNIKQLLPLTALAHSSYVLGPRANVAPAASPCPTEPFYRSAPLMVLSKAA